MARTKVATRDWTRRRTAKRERLDMVRPFEVGAIHTYVELYATALS